MRHFTQAAALLVLLAVPALAEFDGGGGGGSGGTGGGGRTGEVDGTDWPNPMVPNDGLDDSDAFREIMEAAAIDTTIGTLFMPPGVYTFEDSVVVSIDGFQIRGGGIPDVGTWTRGTILEIREAQTTSLGRSAILIGHKPDSTVTRGVTISDLGIRCDQTNRIGHCVWMQNVQMSYMENVVIYANSLYGGDGDRKYAALYIESATDVADNGNFGTTKNTFNKVHIFCPRGLGGSGKGFGLLGRCNGLGGFNNANAFTDCTWNNAVSPGRSIFLTGHTCDDPDDCSSVGAVNGWDFRGCRVDGSIGIEFCASSRNEFWGQIDVNPANGDTALFVQREAEDNRVIGRIDGYFFEEQVNPNKNTSVWDPSWQEGLYSRGLSLTPRAFNQVPSGLTGHPLNKANIWYDSATERLLLRAPDGSIDTLMVRGE